MPSRFFILPDRAIRQSDSFSQRLPGAAALADADASGYESQARWRGLLCTFRPI